MATPRVGQHLSLIMGSSIRYDGMLDSIDVEAGKLTLICSSKPGEHRRGGKPSRARYGKMQLNETNKELPTFLSANPERIIHEGELHAVHDGQPIAFDADGNPKDSPLLESRDAIMQRSDQNEEAMGKEWLARNPDLADKAQMDKEALEERKKKAGANLDDKADELEAEAAKRSA
eukprot:gene51041-20100_t